MSLSKMLTFITLVGSVHTWAYAQSISLPSQNNVPNFTAQTIKQSSGIPAKNKIEFSEHRILVKFKSHTTVNASNFQVSADAVGNLSEGELSALNSVQGKVIKSFANMGVHVVQTPLAVGKAIEMLYRNNNVQYAEPDYKVRAIAMPNDPNFSDLWGLNNTGQAFGIPDADIDAPEAWNIRTDASKVIVGVVDTGVDYTHADLIPNMWINPKEIPGNGIDDDGNGWVDDVHGIDTCNGDADPMDDHFHGTHVSGTIGAKGNNGIGVTGVAWKTNIMALKFLCSDGFGFVSGAIEVINYALVTKINNNYPRMILSNSWGGGEYSQALFDTITLAKGLGVLFIAAAGNEGMDTDNITVYPAGYKVDNVISVGASNSNDDPAFFSNYGCSSVDVFAPGEDILSTMPDNNYNYLSGTSMATPHISGMAAVIWSQNPGKNWRSVKSALMNSVDQPASMSRRSVSQGRANLFKALKPGAMNEPTIWGTSPPSAAPGDTITITGHNFGATPGSVDFNGALLTVLSWSNTTISAKLGQNSLGTGMLKVIRADSNISDSGACFGVSFKPSLVGQTIIPRAWTSGARVGSKYWIIGGEAPWGITGIVESVNMSTFTSAINSQWSMPIPLSNTGSAAIASKIYVVGGYNSLLGIISNSLQIFDTVSKTWKAGASLPQPLMQSAVAAINGKLYVFGGLDGFFGPTNTTYIYDPASNQWLSGTGKGTFTAYAAATSAPGSSKVTVSGGFACSFFGCEQNIVEIYDTVSDTWSSASNLNRSRAGAAHAFFKGKDHVLFGSYQNTTGEYFNGSTWKEAISGPMLYTATGTVCNACKAMVIMGGYDQSFFFGSFNQNIWLLKE